MKKIFIYYLHKGDNVPFYIGKTKDPKIRLREHISLKGKCYMEILEETTIDDWLSKEKYYINYYKKLGYKLENKNSGGGGSKIGTKKHSLKSKQILRENRLGKKLSNKTKSKIYTKERNNKISLKLKNRKFQLEHINKLSQAKIGKPSNASKLILQFDLQGNFIKEWSSISEAKKWLGKGDIQGCVLNKQKTAGGFIWKFKK